VAVRYRVEIRTQNLHNTKHANNRRGSSQYQQQRQKKVAIVVVVVTNIICVDQTPHIHCRVKYLRSAREIDRQYKLRLKLLGYILQNFLQGRTN